MLDFHFPLDSRNAAFPVIATCLFHGCHNIHIAPVIEALLETDEVDEVAVELSALNQCIPAFVLVDSGESVAHNRNQHVQERQLGNKSGKNPQTPQFLLVCVLSECVERKFTKPKNVLVQNCVEVSVACHCCYK